METSKEQLIARKEKLDILCQEFNPFEGAIAQEVRELIEELELSELLSDPFSFTNHVLKELDQIDGELKRNVH
jgi:hypothetical protein